MALFRRSLSPHQTALAMIGARAGTRVLLAGTPAPGLVAELAGVTGLNGQTLLIVPAAAREPYDKAAAEAGVLLETVEPPPAAPMPPTDGTHDVVVLYSDLATVDASARQTLVAAAFNAARPNGRVLIIEGRAKAGWFSRRSESLPAGDALALLKAAGGLAVRQLDSSDGISYFEARKGR